MSSTRINDLLHRTGRTVLVAHALVILMAGMAMFVLTLLAAVAIDATFALPPMGLIVLDMLLAAVAAASLLLMWRQGAADRFDPRRIAVLIERKLNITDNRLINAVDLAGASEGFSEALRDQVVIMGNDFAGRIVPRDVVDQKRVKKAVRTALAALALLLLAMLTIPRVFMAVGPRLIMPLNDLPPYTVVRFAVSTEPQRLRAGERSSIRAHLSGPRLPGEAWVVFINGSKRVRVPMQRGVTEQGELFLLNLEALDRTQQYYIDTPAGRSRRHTLTVLPVPMFERVHLHYSFPAYTRWEPVEEPLGPAGIRALRGTHVAVIIRGNVPLESGTLTLTGAGPAEQAQIALLPTAADPRVVRGEIDLQFSGSYAMVLLGADGTPGEDTLRGSVMSLPDQPPQVRFLEPAERIRAPAGYVVPLRVLATDDVGVARVALHFELHGSTAEMNLELSHAQRARAVADAQFDLAKLASRPGDQLTYYAAAFDEWPGGGQQTNTPVQVIEVISQEQYLDYARSQYSTEQLALETKALQEQLAQMALHREKLMRDAMNIQGWLKELAAPVTDQDRHELAELQRQLAEYARDADRIRRAVQQRADHPALYPFEQPYLDQLGVLARAMAAQSATSGDAAARAERVQTDASSAARGELAAALDRFAQQQSPFTGQERQQYAQIAEQWHRMHLAAQSTEGGALGGARGGAPVLGPHPFRSADENWFGSGLGYRGKEKGGGPQGEVESIDPDADGNRGGGAGFIGVPPPYRDLAEAYFRRMAEENR